MMQESIEEIQKELSTTKNEAQEQIKKYEEEAAANKEEAKKKDKEAPDT